MRIVSLIPEATEILQAIGLEDAVVAVPPEDAHEVDSLVSVLRAAHPTLIFTSETSAGGGMPPHLVRRAIALMSPRPRPAVFALEPRSLGEILSDVKTVGDAVGRQAAARALIERLRVRIDAVSLRAARVVAAGSPRRVVCLHGVDPPVAAGWWLAELVGLAGGLDVLDGLRRPPRAVTWQEIQAAGPDLIVWVDLPGLPWGPSPLRRALIGCADPLRRALIGCDVVRRTIVAGPRPDVPTAPPAHLPTMGSLSAARSSHRLRRRPQDDVRGAAPCRPQDDIRGAAPRRPHGLSDAEREENGHRLPLSLARGLPGWPGGGGFPEAENEVHPGPGAVDVLERLAALIVPGA